MWHERTKYAVLTGVNLRAEKHGEENVPAANLTLTFTAQPEELHELGVHPEANKCSTSGTALQDQGEHDVVVRSVEGDVLVAISKTALKKLVLDVKYDPPAKPATKKPAADKNQQALPGCEPPPEPEPAAEGGGRHTCTLKLLVSFHTDPDSPYWPLHERVKDEVGVTLYDRAKLREAVEQMLVERPVQMILAVDPNNQVVIEERRSEIVQRVVDEREPAEDLALAFERVTASMAQRELAAYRKERDAASKERLAEAPKGSAAWVLERMRADFAACGIDADPDVDGIKLALHAQLEREREKLEDEAVVRSIACAVQRERITDPAGVERELLPSMAYLARQQAEAILAALRGDKWELADGQWFPRKLCLDEARKLYVESLAPTSIPYEPIQLVKRSAAFLLGVRPSKVKVNAGFLRAVEDAMGGWKTGPQEPAETTTETVH